MTKTGFFLSLDRTSDFVLRCPTKARGGRVFHLNPRTLDPLNPLFPSMSDIRSAIFDICPWPLFPDPCLNYRSRQHLGALGNLWNLVLPFDSHEMNACHTL